MEGMKLRNSKVLQARRNHALTDKQDDDRISSASSSYTTSSQNSVMSKIEKLRALEEKQRQLQQEMQAQREQLLMEIESGSQGGSRHSSRRTDRRSHAEEEDQRNWNTIQVQALVEPRPKIKPNSTLTHSKENHVTEPQRKIMLRFVFLMLLQNGLDNGGRPLGGLLWKERVTTLPGSQAKAVKQFHSLERRFEFDTGFCEKYRTSNATQEIRSRNAEEFPEALKKKLYVDDNVNCVASDEEAIRLVQDVKVPARGGFVMGNWVTNSASLRETVPTELRDASQSSTSEILERRISQGIRKKKLPWDERGHGKLYQSRCKCLERLDVVPRSKWKCAKQDSAQDARIEIIVDTKNQRGEWPKDIVAALYPGRDHHTRLWMQWWKIEGPGGHHAHSSKRRTDDSRQRGGVCPRQRTFQL
ncbi:hypothetical protein GE061_012090 [Apolygus lucorum]|uniref:DUF5641 domain-containing protein n=1 Tax=Apolygus lucorum TaxID=248454 RepID=A0A8S9XRM1_APOLU|nr:hypothetical protein GE061_012090 [Apolygus lucorum]